MGDGMIQLRSLVHATQSEALLDVFLTVNDPAYLTNQAKTCVEAKALAGLARQLLRLPDFGIAKQGGYILNFPFTYDVREEFDVLRFSRDTVLNIELKSQFPRKSSIIAQLRRHKAILDVLGKQTILCSFIRQENKLYLLQNDSLIPITFRQLGNLITDDYLLENELAMLSTPAKQRAAKQHARKVAAQKQQLARRPRLKFSFKE
ncbi:hypothetical protein KAR50_05445 [Periweissella fabaria]|uniref:GxxExxY protein n=1 Tax=Periweissella fabaria TaxID=546157 RepID=A0ABM8Z4E7_9LACO|nr:hypothetical protein [Periweissella fabaria]MCM0597285.1 hypothetical protein [Periweissella fabaria]CAH0416209.1 hypothetical protein WFA24289_00508 [Periweissella fabaria]